MEIHKPRPIHNWREFLKEYAIIVIGVLTALGAEQAAEWVHWQGEVKIARQSIAAEMLVNNRNLFARRLAIAPCINRRLDEAEAIIAALESGRKPNPMTSFRPASGALVTESEWQSERASQVLTHFPRAELALMSRYYAQIPNFPDWLNVEGQAWTEMTILQNPPAGITTPDIIRLRVSLANAQRMAFLIRLNANRQLVLSRRLGLAEAKPDAAVVQNYCGSASLEEYQRWSLSREVVR